MFELDLRAQSTRTMHMFINGVQQKPYATNLPESIHFAIELSQPGDSVKYTAYSTPIAPSINSELSTLPLRVA